MIKQGVVGAPAVPVLEHYVCSRTALEWVCVMAIMARDDMWRGVSSALANLLGRTCLKFENRVGANSCRMARRWPQDGNCRVAFSAIDDVFKGAADPAVRNANAMFGFLETRGLWQLPVLQ